MNSSREGTPARRELFVAKPRFERSDSNPNILLVHWAGRLEPPGSKHQEHLGESFFTAYYVDSASKKKLFLLFLIPHAGGLSTQSLEQVENSFTYKGLNIVARTCQPVF